MTPDNIDALNTGINKDESDIQKHFDYDGFWKELIDRFFYSLIKRAIPELYENADTTLKPRFLDKEFRDILSTGKIEIRKDPHFADFVLEVPKKNREVEWILLHIEAQHGYGGGDLAERMYHYKCLIYSHYRKNPVALAIISGAARKDERFYSHTHYGTSVVYHYNNLVLIDIDDNELKESDNPIDIALYAAKCALKAKEEFQKFNYLRELLNLLSARGWSREDKRDLLLFLEWIMDLRDSELEKQYTEYRSQLNEEGKIMYIPLGERELAKELEQRGEARGKAEGKAEGKADGKAEMVRNLIANGISPDIVAKSAGMSVEQIQSMMN